MDTDAIKYSMEIANTYPKLLPIIIFIVVLSLLAYLFKHYDPNKYTSLKTIFQSKIYRIIFFTSLCFVIIWYLKDIDFSTDNHTVWNVVYELDENNKCINGSLNKLIESIEKGSDIKVSFKINDSLRATCNCDWVFIEKIQEEQNKDQETSKYKKIVTCRNDSLVMNIDLIKTDEEKAEEKVEKQKADHDGAIEYGEIFEEITEKSEKEKESERIKKEVRSLNKWSLVLTSENKWRMRSYPSFSSLMEGYTISVSESDKTVVKWFAIY